jgi:hypothetical protein
MKSPYDLEMFPIRSLMTEERYAELSAWTYQNCRARGVRSWGHLKPQERLELFLAGKVYERNQ